MCVCVGVSDSTTAFDDPSISALCVMCIGHFLGGSKYAPPGCTQCSAPGSSPGSMGFGEAPRKKIGHFLLFLADFAIFS